MSGGEVLEAETLERAFAHLKANGIKVDKARMDCGSYSQEVVNVTCCNCNTFYSRTTTSAGSTCPSRS